jgi:hypothetical protein
MKKIISPKLIGGLLLIFQFSSCSKEEKVMLSDNSELKNGIAEIVNTAYSQTKNSFGTFATYTENEAKINSAGLFISNTTYLSTHYKVDNAAWLEEMQTNQSSLNYSNARVQTNAVGIQAAKNALVNGRLPQSSSVFRHFAPIQISTINELLDAIYSSTTFPELKTKINGVEAKLPLLAISPDQRTEILVMTQSLRTAISDFEAVKTMDDLDWLASNYSPGLAGGRKAATSEANAEANASARVQGNCKVNVRSVLAGAVLGGMINGINGAITGGTIGTFTVPILGTATGAIGGFVFGFASGFAGSAATGIVVELMTSCFRPGDITYAFPRQLKKKFINGKWYIDYDKKILQPAEPVALALSN